MSTIQSRISAIRRTLARSFSNAFCRGEAIEACVKDRFDSVSDGIAVIHDFGRRGAKDAAEITKALNERDAYRTAHASWSIFARREIYMAKRKHIQLPESRMPLYKETIERCEIEDEGIRVERASLRKRQEMHKKLSPLNLLMVSAEDAIRRIINRYGNADGVDQYTVHVSDADMGDAKQANVLAVKYLSGFSGSSKYGYSPRFDGIVVARRQYPRLRRFLLDRTIRLCQKSTVSSRTERAAKEMVLKLGENTPSVVFKHASALAMAAIMRGDDTPLDNEVMVKIGSFKAA